MSTTRSLLIIALALAIMVLPAGAGENKNTIRGAVYVPAKAFNAPQMWKNYSPRVTRRDMGYAKKINLNALRVWASYEYWRIDPDHFKKSFDDFLDAAEENGLGIYPSLFENCGVPPTWENMWSTDPNATYCVNSPHKEEIGKHPERWNETAEWIKWFMDNYKDDERLLAIEVMNEPTKHMVEFAKEMLKVANKNRGTRPITIGTSGPGGAKQYIKIGMDIIQFHNNFPKDRKTSNANIEDAIRIGKELNIPVWMAEWQRLRPTGAGFRAGLKMTEEEKYSGYSTMVHDVQKYEIGTFFWSLMVKPAYLAGQRANGTINGLFWEDGAVWSLEDARAIAGDPDLQLKERQLKTHEEVMAFKAKRKRGNKKSTTGK